MGGRSNSSLRMWHSLAIPLKTFCLGKFLTFHWCILTIGIESHVRRKSSAAVELIVFDRSIASSPKTGPSVGWGIYVWLGGGLTGGWHRPSHADGRSRLARRPNPRGGVLQDFGAPPGRQRFAATSRCGMERRLCRPRYGGRRNRIAGGLAPAFQ